MARVAQGWAGATSGELSRGRAPRAAEASAVASPLALRTSPAPGCFRAPPGTDVARLRAAAKAPDPEAGPKKPRASRGRRAGREEGRGRGGVVVGVRGWRCRRCDAAARPVPDQRTRCPRLLPDPGRCS